MPSFYSQFTSGMNITTSITGRAAILLAPDPTDDSATGDF